MLCSFSRCPVFIFLRSYPETLLYVFFLKSQGFFPKRQTVPGIFFTIMFMYIVLAFFLHDRNMIFFFICCNIIRKSVSSLQIVYRVNGNTDGQGVFSFGTEYFIVTVAVAGLLMAAADLSIFHLITAFPVFILN